MGLWVLITLALVIVMNLVLYLFIEERWGGIASLDSAYHQQYIALRQTFVVVLCVETLLFAVGIIGLAMFTAHRIAGPYIRLERVFDAVRDGNLDQKLRFRKSDHLGRLEQHFDDMMAAIRKGADRGSDT